ncbi:hypothetical protein ElyMa_006654000 [Elysia marginata]|uniref:Uncharacterized protein n=1 Tax=Elysia marginata TaxID=1093978 RepID=A0AAV4IM19_9GAST|nr:hypothetical protein ElyMa_006654000 [Elysia marginata]
MIKTKNKKPSESRTDQVPLAEQRRAESLDAKGILGRLDSLAARGIPDTVSLAHDMTDVLALRRDITATDTHSHAASAFLQKQTAEELGLDLRRMAAFHLAIASPLSPGLKMESAEDLSLRDWNKLNSSRSEDRETPPYARCKEAEAASNQVSVKVGEVLSCSIDKGFGLTPDKQQSHLDQTAVTCGTTQHRGVSHSPGPHHVTGRTSPSAETEKTPTLTDSATSPSPPTCLRIPTVYCVSKYRSREDVDNDGEDNHSEVDVKTSPPHTATVDSQSDAETSNEILAIHDGAEDNKGDDFDEPVVLPDPQSPCSSDIDV